MFYLFSLTQLLSYSGTLYRLRWLVNTCWFYIFSNSFAGEGGSYTNRVGSICAYWVHPSVNGGGWWGCFHGWLCWSLGRCFWVLACRSIFPFFLFNLEAEFGTVYNVIVLVIVQARCILISILGIEHQNLYATAQKVQNGLSSLLVRTAVERNVFKQKFILYRLFTL